MEQDNSAQERGQAAAATPKSAATEAFPVRNRWTDATQFTAEITFRPDVSVSVKLGLAIKWAIASGANLSGANLRGEKVSRTFAALDRSDGYTFRAYELEAGGVKIHAGCRWFTPEEYRAHVAAEYPDTEKGAETLLIVGFIEARAGQVGAAIEKATDGPQGHGEASAKSPGSPHE